jgi:hypothetical protein
VYGSTAQQASKQASTGGRGNCTIFRISTGHSVAKNPWPLRNLLSMQFDCARKIANGEIRAEPAESPTKPFFRRLRSFVLGEHGLYICELAGLINIVLHHYRIAHNRTNLILNENECVTILESFARKYNSSTRK